MESLHSNKSGYLPSKRFSSCGIAASGLVFYFAHVLQQAQARDTALMNDTLPSDTKLADVLTDDSTPIEVTSVDQLEPVMMASNSSYAVTTTLVSDDDEDDQTIENSGKDAIDVPSQGASPLLLLGGVALIGGGIAVLTNDDSNSDDSNSTTAPEFHLEGIATLGHTLSVSGKYDSIQWMLGEDVGTMSSEENNQTFTPIAGENQGTLVLTEKFFGKTIYAEVVVDGKTYTTSQTDPQDWMFLQDLARENPGLYKIQDEWQANKNDAGSYIYQLSDPTWVGYGNNWSSDMETDAPIRIGSNYQLEMTGQWNISEDYMTELNLSDGLWVNVSTNNGATWQPLQSYNTPYTFNNGTQSAWTGSMTEENILFDLSAFEGQIIKLKVSFSSDGWDSSEGKDEYFYVELSDFTIKDSTDDIRWRDNFDQSAFEILPQQELDYGVQQWENGLLKIFALTYSGISEVPTSIGSLGSLETLILNNNNLIEFPDPIKELTDLKKLSIKYNDVSDELPDLSTLQQLEILELDGNNFTGSLPDTLFDLTQLTKIDLDSNELTGGIPISIANLTKLIELDLDFNQLTGSIRSEIGDLILLNSLDLSKNQLSGPIPNSLTNLTNLEFLSAWRNDLSGNIPYDIGNMSQLETISLGGNELSGKIPDSISNIEDLVTLSLWGNDLSGQIPDSIGNLSNLEILYLNNNQLSGVIPKAIGNLSNLERLYLDNNQLSGEIPGEIESLTALERFYIQDNNLSGEVPLSLLQLAPDNNGALEILRAYNNPDLVWVVDGLNTVTELQDLGVNQVQYDWFDAS